MRDTKEGIKIALEDYLQDDGQVGCITDEEKISYPLYQNCYIEALNAILEGMSRYRQEKYQEECRKETRFIGSVDYEKESIFNLNHVNNMITFMGGRGSGKTTAINEFSNILRNFEQNCGRWCEHLSVTAKEMAGEDAIQFIVLNPIDASVLDAKENLMELVWANMYQYYEQEAPGIRNMECREDSLDNKRKLIKEFDNLYTHYNMLGNQEDKLYPGETVLSRMKSMSSSLKIRSTFAELLADYFQVLGRPSCKRHCLVITIDDLDLNMEKGYEMLDQLHKYLSHPGIIVLLAMDFKQISLLCQAYFEQHSISNIIPVNGRVMRHSQDLSNDYLLKVFPIVNRIHMPGKKQISRKAIIQENGSYWRLKEFILYKIAQKTSIYYDGRGQKRHFAIPQTVREVVAYNAFLDSLFNVVCIRKIEEENHNAKQMRQYDINHEQFNSDIVMRMAYQILSPEQKELFDILLGLNLERRANYAVIFCNAWGEKGIDTSDNVDEQKYRYGDLLESLYKLGRRKIEYKALVHCLLASFTSEFTREYYSFLCNRECDMEKRREEKEEKEKREEESEKAKNRLKFLLGTTFGNQWLGAMVTAIQLPVKEGTFEGFHGYAEDVHLEMMKIEWKLGIVNCAQETEIPLDNIKEIVDKIAKKRLIPMWRCILMLTSEYVDSRSRLKPVIPQINLKIEGDNRENELKIEIEVNAQATLDVFGFIGKTLVDERNLLIEKSMKNGLKKALCKYWKRIDDNKKKQVDSIVDKKWRQLALVDSRRTEGVAFPFYNLDLSYNVMKRVRRRCEESLEDRIKAEQFRGYMQRVYGFVADELFKEDQFYNQRKDGFAERFINCEFIRLFGIKLPKGDCCEEFKAAGPLLPEEFDDLFVKAVTFRELPLIPDAIEE